MTDEQQIRIIFPESTGLGVVVLPLAEVATDEPYAHKEGFIIQLARVNGWSMERTLDSAGHTVPGAEDDGNHEYTREAMIAWLSWYAWLLQQPTADDREQGSAATR